VLRTVEGHCRSEQKRTWFDVTGPDDAAGHFTAERSGELDLQSAASVLSLPRLWHGDRSLRPQSSVIDLARLQWFRQVDFDVQSGAADSRQAQCRGHGFCAPFDDHGPREISSRDP
jgi:hypothetical protein